MGITDANYVNMNFDRLMKEDKANTRSRRKIKCEKKREEVDRGGHARKMGRIVTGINERSN